MCLCFVEILAMCTVFCTAIMAHGHGAELPSWQNPRTKRYADTSQSKPTQEEGQCRLQINCPKADNNQQPAIKLPISGPRGPPGPTGEKGDRGVVGEPGRPGPRGMDSSTTAKVAYFARLRSNIQNTPESADIVFDDVVTNVGSSYSGDTGKFTAPVDGYYQIQAAISAIGHHKAAVDIVRNGQRIFPLWSSSFPWATSSNQANVFLKSGDKVWVRLRTRLDKFYLHGYQYSTFSGNLLFQHKLIPQEAIPVL